MRQGIFFLALLAAVGMIFLLVLLGGYYTVEKPVKVVKMGVESGEVTFSNGTQTEKIRPGEKAMVRADGVITRIETPAVAAPVKKTVAAAPGELASLAVLSLSVQTTESEPVRSATAVVRQGDHQQVLTTNRDGKAVVEHLQPGPAEIQVNDPSILAGNRAQAVIQAGTNTVRLIVTKRGRILAYLKNQRQAPVTQAAATITPATEAQKIQNTDLAEHAPKEDGSLVFDPLAAGEYLLAVTAPPYLPYEGTIRAKENAAPQTIVLSERSQIIVTAQNEENKPIGGAHVTLQSTGKGQGILSAQQTNGLSGTTVFPNVLPGMYRISAQHAWYQDGGKGSVELAVKNSEHRVVLTLANRSYRISGNVYEKESKKPIPNAEVIAFLDRPGGKVSPDQPDAKATTQADGSYTLDGLRGGVYIMGVISHPEYVTDRLFSRFVPGTQEPTRVMLGNEPEVKGVDFALISAWIVTGRVLLHDGSPLEGAEVEAAIQYASAGGAQKSISTFGTSKKAVSSKDGTYRFVGTDDVFKAGCKVNIFANHAVYKMSPMVVIEPQSGQELSGIDLVYDERVLFTGTVTDSQDQPIDAARLLIWLTSESISRGASLVTQPDGSFKVGLSPGTYSAQISKDGYKYLLPDTPIVLEAGKTPEPRKYVLEAGDSSFEGWVSEEDGTPAAGLEVNVMNFGRGRDPGNNSPMMMPYVPALASGGPKSMPKTDENGQFKVRVDRAEPGDQFMIFTQPTDQYEGSSYRTAERGAKDIHLIVKKKESEYGGISGRVVDENHQPIPNFQVRLIPSQMTTPAVYPTYNWRSVMHPEGAFLFEKALIADGPFVVAAKSGNNNTVLSELVSIAKDEMRENVTIVLPQSFQLIGQVVDTEGKPVSGAAVEALQEAPAGLGSQGFSAVYGDLPARTESDANGLFRLDGFPAKGGQLRVWLGQSTSKGGKGGGKDTSLGPSGGLSFSIFRPSDIRYEKRFPIPPGQPGEQRDLGKIVLEPPK